MFAPLGNTALCFFFVEEGVRIPIPKYFGTRPENTFVARDSLDTF